MSANEKQQKRAVRRILIIAFVSVILIIGFMVINVVVIQPKIEKKNMAAFKTTYESALVPLLEKNDLALVSIDYPELIPDDYLDYWEIERINKYRVTVYVSGDIINYEELYDLLIDIKCANDYLLSNTYEMLPSYSYVDDGSKETGFHEIYTTLIFEDGTAYSREYISLQKNGVDVWNPETKPVTEESLAAEADAWGWGCLYEDCTHSRVEGRLFCYRHVCSVKGCTNETSPLQSYCWEHRQGND